MALTALRLILGHLRSASYPLLVLQNFTAEQELPVTSVKLGKFYSSQISNSGHAEG